MSARTAIVSIEVGSRNLALTSYSTDSGNIPLPRPADTTPPVFADSVIAGRGFRRVNEWENVAYGLTDLGVWYADVEEVTR
ncbi:hypothetical protein AB0B94_31050 [Micromonospora sp. NPDC048986]|uniref:hypothetical protein n=1 Tax=Micromonospora sp. NPDC048986 TaxID=3155644 RepID=UPI0033FF5571